MTSAEVAAHNARIYRARMAAARRNMMSGSGFHAHGAPQLLDAKWSASEARENKGTFRVDASTAVLWQKAIRREPTEDHQGAHNRPYPARLMAEILGE